MCEERFFVAFSRLCGETFRLENSPHNISFRINEVKLSLELSGKRAMTVYAPNSEFQPNPQNLLTFLLFYAINFTHKEFNLTNS